LIAGTACLAASFAVPATAAMAQPAVIPLTGSHCNPDPLAAATACTTVIGGGLQINAIQGGGFSNYEFTITEVHVEIYGPNGTIHNCTQFDLASYGSVPTCTWKNPQPSKTWPAGDYCSRLWEYTGGGSYADLSNACVDVHA
jgi:hypothetical protein